ncbi:MAG TPA: adenylate/guanylate cyclase domain-containing protein [Usitatibacter sp.]|nr:adenylate/guanylate cyclase domain-containing protein [Usitatibacter sp.]
MERLASTMPPRVAAIAAAAIILFFGALGFLPAWNSIELKGFDELSVSSAPGRSSKPITIVGLDDASVQAIGMQMPFPRGLNAQLIDKLNEAGAMVIAFDMLFDQPSREGDADDAAFARAIAKAGNVVVASDLIYQETPHGRLFMRVEPVKALRDAGAASGFAGVDLDADLVMRKVPQADDAFWRVIIRRAGRRMPELLEFAQPDRNALVRYAGRDHTFPFIPYYQVLEGLPKDALRDHVVIVGRELRASVDQGAAQGDLFYTPFTGSTGALTPGAEIHANVLESVLRGDTIAPASALSRLLALVAAVAAAALLMSRWRPVASAAACLGLVAVVAAIDWILFVRANVWLPVFASMAGVAATYLVFGGVVFVAEQQRKNEMRRAFSLYVSREVVDHVLAHPERLSLGGERREVTMFFTDLEGFTPLTERLGAEQVARILNMHFSRATAIIKRHGGTVNRFIGDAIMAMWGAPVDDPRQAVNAVRAAVDVQRDLEELRRDLGRQGLPEIRMRVGIHTCVAVVGNLGSEDRFDYTAIGDGVNLAARLEGVNKLYGTGILVSGDTFAKVAGEMPLRPVDRVIVKGKSEPVDIYTPCEDAALVAATDQAIAAYRARDWDEAERSWLEIAAEHPDDGIASVYLARIEKLRSTSIAREWNGAVELEKL